MIDPAVAQTAKDVLSTVVTSGTGEHAQTGEPTWGKTGTTDDNGDAWFCGATEEITACVWVGHPDTVTPMETEFAGAPVDGGTFPALIFADIVTAYDELADARKAPSERRPRTTRPTRPRRRTESAAPAAPATEPAAPAAPRAGARARGADGAGARLPRPPPSGGAPAAPSGGGIAPG